MKVVIHQLNWNKLEDREMRLTITCDGQIANILHAMIDGKYDEVATVNTSRQTLNDQEIDNTLEIAYMLTQNLESKWIDNLDVEVTDAVREKGGCKSSSVGDVFQIEDKFYAVAGCGFEEVTVEKARAEKRAA